MLCGMERSVISTGVVPMRSWGLEGLASENMYQHLNCGAVPRVLAVNSIDRTKGLRWKWHAHDFTEHVSYCGAHYDGQSANNGCWNTCTDRMYDDPKDNCPLLFVSIQTEIYFQ